jgi:hypothetical protein
MFRYFPTNYVWDLSVNLAIEMGGRMGEIAEMCAPLADAAKSPDAEGTRAFREAWVRVADRLIGLADDDLTRGRSLSASNKLMRAACYQIIAERMQAHGAEGRMALYRKHLATFYQALSMGRTGAHRVEIPYEGRHLSGIFVPAQGVSGPQPLLVQVNGFDSTKEMRLMAQLPGILARRGIASLVLDQPGTGEALRLQGFHARHDAEHWATPVYDWLAARPDVDAARIGMEGVSLGRLLRPPRRRVRAALCLRGQLGRQPRLARRPEAPAGARGRFPRPALLGACLLGVRRRRRSDDFMQKAEHMHLDGILDRIRVPYPGHPRQARHPDPAEMGAADLRAAGQQPAPRTGDLRRTHRGCHAFQRRQFGSRSRLHFRFRRRMPRRPHA